MLKMCLTVRSSSIQKLIVQFGISPVSLSALSVRLHVSFSLLVSSLRLSKCPSRLFIASVPVYEYVCV